MGAHRCDSRGLKFAASTVHFILIILRDRVALLPLFCIYIAADLVCVRIYAARRVYGKSPRAVNVLIIAGRSADYGKPKIMINYFETLHSRCPPFLVRLLFTPQNTSLALC